MPTVDTGYANGWPHSQHVDLILAAVVSFRYSGHIRVSIYDDWCRVVVGGQR